MSSWAYAVVVCVAYLIVLSFGLLIGNSDAISVGAALVTVLLIPRPERAIR